MSLNTESKQIKFTNKEKEYAENMRNCILSGTPDEADYKTAKSFWDKILQVIN